MSDIVLSLGVTVVLLAVLAAWVPMLYAAERLMRRNQQDARVKVRKLPQTREPAPMPEAVFEQEIAQ